jgi:hypothetical protein
MHNFMRLELRTKLFIASLSLLALGAGLLMQFG